MQWTIILIKFVLLYISYALSAPATKEDSEPLVSHRFADVRTNPYQPTNFWSEKRYKWPRGQIVYTLSTRYTSSEKNIIMNAIKEWEAKTCVRFVPKKQSDRDYVEITPDDGTQNYCYCYVGRQGGKQVMKMFGECVRHAAMVHELGHAIGFNHEHQRPDRDDYVTVNFDNIEPAYHYAFKKYTSSQVDNMGTPYDYSSVMQYPSYAFSKNGKPAMTLKDGSTDKIKREAEHLSSIDIRKAQKYYNNCG